jgi:glucosyl-dolichyl phosphate glucuronosyltransferase
VIGQPGSGGSVSARGCDYHIEGAGRIEGTVIVCTRNRASLLPAALESLANQVTNRVFEILVVNNASEDRTAEVIAEWCRRDARFRTVNEPRIGLSTAKNAGVRAARGHTVLFTDDDVLVEPNWVEAHLDLLSDKHGLIIAGGPILPITHDLAPWPQWLGEASRDLPWLDHGGPARPLGRWDRVWGANMAIPRAAFDRVGSWNEELGRKGDQRGTWEDLEFADRVRNSGGQVWFCPGAVVHHRIMPELVLPRRILGRAFLRGQDECVRGVWASDEPGGARLSHLERAVAFLSLSAHLLSWISCSMLFRIFRTRRTFDAARGAAWSAGWRVMELTLRRSPGGGRVEPPFLFNERSRVARALRKVCRRARRVALRLAPPA